MDKKIYFFLIICIMGILQSCAEDNININADNMQDQNDQQTGNPKPTNPNTKLCTLYFNANIYDMINGLHVSKTIQPIAPDRKVSIYIYNDKARYSKYNLESKIIGSLSMPNDSLIVVEEGAYKFFAPGTNTINTTTPDFDKDGYTSVLNNIDYIWWSKTNTNVNEPLTSYTMDMIHCCTQVVIKVLTPGNINEGTFPEISITPSVTNESKWSLYSGIINSASKIDKLNSLSATKVGNAYFAQIIMVPLAMKGDLTIQVKVPILNDNPIILKTQVSIYNDDLKAGYTYQYTLSLDNNVLLFNKISIIDWVHVDANDKPIIPVEI